MQTIQWSPFSQKHIDYIHKSIDCKMSVAEGSVRAGKTIDNCICSMLYLETCEDKLHLASGSSIANAKLNIGDCNGFGLEHLFKGRCRWGKYKDNDALFINTKTGEKIVIFAGGGKADSYKKILGNSYGLWIATEANEHYDCDDSRTSFIKVAMARQAASKQPKILWDLNPCSPTHRIYVDYIDKYEQQGLIGGYNYGHFTINDNLSISDERREEIKSMYDENSIWYRRDMLGERCVAEGLVHKKFAENTNDYLLEQPPRNIIAITIGVDFGGNGSKHTFVCTGVTSSFGEVVVLENERIETDVSPVELEEKFVEFVKKCYEKYKKPIRTYADSAEQTLIRGFRIASMRKGLINEVLNAKKKPITDRIKLTEKLMAQNRFYVMRYCKHVIKAMQTSVWNSKKPDERLDDGSTDIETIDSMEYSIEPFMNSLLQTGGGKEC